MLPFLCLPFHRSLLHACRVEVGGGRWQDAATLLLQHLPLWACLGALTLNLLQVWARSQQEPSSKLSLCVPLSCCVALILQVPLPMALDSVTAILAPANRPLMLLATGLTLTLDMPQPRMVCTASVVQGDGGFSATRILH